MIVLTTPGGVFVRLAAGTLRKKKKRKKQGPENGRCFDDVEPLWTVCNGWASSKDRPETEPGFEIGFETMFEKLEKRCGKC